MVNPLNRIDTSNVSETTPAGRWAGPLLISAATLVMLQWTWLTWPDAFIDFGRELYTPWQILQGEVLYKDLALFNGPLSPYLNACWFLLFGVSLRTLAFCNLLIIFVVLILLYKMATDVAGRVSATVACLTFVTIFAFSQYIGVGNFNWMSPYSHEITHGIALSLVSIYCFGQFIRKQNKPMAAAAGFALGLVFLTKPEIFLAAAAALASGAGLWFWSARIQRFQASSTLLLITGSALVPPLLSVILLSTAMPLPKAFMGTLGSWPYLFHKEHTNLYFFHLGMGMVDPSANLLRLLAWTLRYIAVLLPALIIAMIWTRRRRVRIPSLILLVLAAAVLWFYRSAWMSLPESAASMNGILDQALRFLKIKQFARPWPLLLLVVTTTMFIRLVRSRENPEQRTHALLCLVPTIFAFCLLLKMILFTRVWHYGFGLAMPAAMVLVVALMDGLPSLIKSLGGSAPVFRWAALFLWMVVVVLHLGMIRQYITPKTVAVASGPDKYFTDSRGREVEDALEAILSTSREDQTLTAMPDGEILGYLSRRRNPSRYANYIPATVILFGEEPMLSALQANPPDFIALVHHDTSEYGFRFFGHDYALRIWNWIMSAYEPVHRSGAPVFNEQNLFGILLLQRKQPPSGYRNVHEP